MRRKKEIINKIPPARVLIFFNFFFTFFWQLFLSFFLSTFFQLFFNFFSTFFVYFFQHPTKASRLVKFLNPNEMFKFWSFIIFLAKMSNLLHYAPNLYIFGALCP